MVIMLAVLLFLAACDLVAFVFVAIKLEAVVNEIHGRLKAMAEDMQKQGPSLAKQVDDAGARQVANMQKVLDAKVEADRDHIRAEAADMGIALAERMARVQRGPKGEKRLTSHDKAQMAVDYALEHCKSHSVSATPSELRKLIEVRLEQAGQIHRQA